MSPLTVAVTGASGFLGRALIRRLTAEGIAVRAVSRAAASDAPSVVNIRADIRDSAQLTEAFDGVDSIFHLAAHVHDVESSDDTAQQQAITLGGTVAALAAAEQAGVRNVILASSLAVFGSVGSDAASEDHPCLPDTPYGRAKLAAEKALIEFTARTGAFGASIRPAMMYGVPCPGNLPRMVRAVNAGWFPPVPEFGNRRSMISVDDVAFAMLLAWRAEVGGGRAFILTDRVAYSTRQIYDMIRQALGRRTSGFVIPPFVFSAAAQVGDVVGALLGRRVFFDSHAFDRVAGSAYFDSSRALRELGFVPTTTLREVMPALVRSVVHEQATRSTE